ncbi:MAG: prephenate dehydrogenase/arogenate dehydrogenase family protein [Chloroflexi bacterium]|nr:prephenate dehydrogenase/arogenate dehydrogenase family protein [Chloroflexota bacterium]
MQKVTIIGLGLIGGSIGMALKAAKLKDVEIVGHDKEPSASSKARKRGAVDKTEWNLLTSVSDASMVIIATPVLAIKEVMQQIAPKLSEGCTVTDTGSTKVNVLEWAKEYLPPSVSFVGGHPMAGKEESGVEHAEVDLFRDRTYCVIPGKDAASSAVKTVLGMVETLGAKPFFLDPVEHDMFVAGVSHLPLVMSAALVSATAKSPAWNEMARLASSGYRDVSRLASGNPEMNRDICVTNRQGVIHWIDAMIQELQDYRRLVSECGEELGKTFISVWETRERWLKGVHEHLGAEASAFAEIPKASESFTSMIIGDRLARRSRSLMEATEKKGEGKPWETPKK